MTEPGVSQHPAKSSPRKSPKGTNKEAAGEAVEPLPGSDCQGRSPAEGQQKGAEMGDAAPPAVEKSVAVKSPAPQADAKDAPGEGRTPGSDTAAEPTMQVSPPTLQMTFLSQPLS